MSIVFRFIKQSAHYSYVDFMLHKKKTFRKLALTLY